MKVVVKLALIIIAIFVIGIFLIFAIDYYSTPRTTIPNVPTMSAMNCSYSTKTCSFSINNPGASTTIIKGVVNKRK